MVNRKRIAQYCAIILVFSSFVRFTPQANACMWGDNICAVFVKQALEELARQMEGMVNGILKASAVPVLTSQVAQLIGGSSSGSSAVIANWRSFLYDEPGQKVGVYMEDWFTQISRGRASSANYDSPYSLANGTNPTIGNYSASLVEAGRASLNKSPQPCKELDRFPDPASAIDNDGSIEALNALFSNEMCNPFGFVLETQSVAMQKTQEEENIRFVESLSDGYKSIKDASGNVKIPAGNVKDIVSNSLMLGQDMLKNIQNPAEFAVVLATSYVNKAVQKMFGNIQANIQREISNVDQQISAQFNEINQALGPAAGFVREVRQQTNVIVKPATNSKAAIPQHYDP